MKRAQRNFLKGALGCALAIAGSAWAADPILIDVDPAFKSVFQDYSVIRVTVSNSGPGARGELVVPTKEGETVYPVELPQGSKKAIIAFPAESYVGNSVTLRLDRGTFTRRYEGGFVGRAAGGSALLISDEEGGLGFLRAGGNAPRQVLSQDYYATAEDAPDRLRAYKNFHVIALGPGSERMSDATAETIKLFALSGGHVIFFGGASSPILSDPRFTGLIPGRDWTPKTLSSSKFLAKYGVDPVVGSYTVLTPASLLEGATSTREGNVPVEVTQGYGLGRVTVLGYSLLDRPFDTWEGREKLFVRYVRTGDSIRGQRFFDLNAGVNSNEYGYGGWSGPGPGAFSTSPPTYYSGMSVQQDPFSMTLPQTNSIFMLLGVYFVLVVPVNFLVLRKLKRGEWAWFTAPVMSVGFAALLFQSARNLYAASLSTATQGVIVAQEGAPDALFAGQVKMFFPRGGSYDLKLKNVDRLSPHDALSYSYGMRDRDRSEGYNLVDRGNVEAPNFEVTNLAFREVDLVQKVNTGDLISMETLGPTTVKLTNRSKYMIRGLIVYRGARSGGEPELSPGASQIVELGTEVKVQSGPQSAMQIYGENDERNYLWQSRRLAVSCTIEGVRLGPEIGQEVAQRSKVRLLVLSKEAVR